MLFLLSMMMSLFSSFDYSIFSGQKVLLLIMFFFIMHTAHLTEQQTIVVKTVKMEMMMFLNSLGSSRSSLAYAQFVLTIMAVLMFMNIFSIFPNVFSSTSQISVVMQVSFSCYLGFVVFQIYCNHKSLVAHLIPEGSPIILSPLLFLIELVSNLIRPITLMVRLVANITAGHLLMVLLSEMALNNFLVTPAYALLNIVEMFVAVIQSYIFFVMVSLYYFEVS